MGGIIYLTGNTDEHRKIVISTWLQKHGITKISYELPNIEDGTQNNKPKHSKMTQGKKATANDTIVIVDEQLTRVSNYINNGGYIDYLIVANGYVGSNIVSERAQLSEFKGKDMVEIEAFSKDEQATDSVFGSNSANSIGSITLVGANVLSSENRETVISKLGLSSDTDNLTIKSVMTCNEALSTLGLYGFTRENSLCNYLPVKLNKKKTDTGILWGSKLGICADNTYRTVSGAVYKSMIQKDKTDAKQ